LIGISGVLLLCFATVGLLIAIRGDEHSSVPPGVQEASSFQLYHPTWLPAGYAMNTESYDITSQVVTFSARLGRQSLLFSEQARPEGFNFETFYEDQMTKKRFVQTSTGRAVIGEFEGVQSASLVAGQTWLLIRAPSGLAIGDFEQLLKGVKKAGN
jgi:hypothetical protein